MSARVVLVALVALGLAVPAAAQNALICIDPGHGGSDPGAVGNGLEEADLNLAAGLAFRDWLDLDSADAAGGGSWDVIMTRDTNSSVSLSARCDYANAAGADYFMSIHTNAGGGNGTETYAYAWASAGVGVSGFQAGVRVDLRLGRQKFDGYLGAFRNSLSTQYLDYEFTPVRLLLKVFAEAFWLYGEITVVDHSYGTRMRSPFMQ